MSSTIPTEHSPIPISKMVNDLFLQWLSLPETRSTLSAALNSVRTNSKMPDHINYSKSNTTRGAGYTKSQHFDSPPVSPVPRTPASPRSSASVSFAPNETSGSLSSRTEEKKQRSSVKTSTSFNGSTTLVVDQQHASIEKEFTAPATNVDKTSSSLSVSTSVSSLNRAAIKTTTTQSKDVTPKPAQPTPLSQERSQSPPSAPLEQISKSSTKTISSLHETSDNISPAPLTTKAKITVTPSSTSEPVTRSVPVPSKNTAQQTTTTPAKPEQKLKPDENIPKFYFPDEQLAAVSSRDAQIAKQLQKAQEGLFMPKNDKLRFEDFGKLAQLIDLSLYWKTPLFRACVSDIQGPKATITTNTTVTYSQFESFWKKVCKTNHDNALKFMYLLLHSSPSSTALNRQYISIDDWDYLVQDIIDTHPGLKFLREAREFHTRYIKTVVARVYYVCNRSWSGKLTLQELRRSNFLQTFDRLEQEEDINRIHDYFSYEHFYVIYCKFWELDSDHDLFISRDDLAKHNNGAISNKIIDRIFSGAVSNSQNMKEGKMSYYEFVWFLISEEDKCTQTSIEYWFRCMDIDGDGILSMYELEYFYQEQVHKMEIYGIEYMPFEDCICQMLDLVKPEEENKIRLKDLKRCKLTNIFYDTFFNLEKYLANEQKDPFSNVKDPDAPEVSDWVKYAEVEYDNLTHEDGANDDLDDVNYDEDFEDDDEKVEDTKNSKKPTNNSASASQRPTSTSNNSDDDFEEEGKRWKD